jgi:hypothetical protein
MKRSLIGRYSLEKFIVNQFDIPSPKRHCSESSLGSSSSSEEIPIACHESEEKETKQSTPSSTSIEKHSTIEHFIEECLIFPNSLDYNPHKPLLGGLELQNAFKLWRIQHNNLTFPNNASLPRFLPQYLFHIHSQPRKRTKKGSFYAIQLK